MPTTIYFFEWKTGLFAPSGLLSGYSGSTIPAHPAIEIFGDPSDTSAVYNVAGTFDISTVATGQLGCLYSFVYPTSGTISGNVNLRVETGTSVGAGSTFTVLTPESLFSGNSVREVKVWPEFGRFQFNAAAIANLGITNITISGNVDAMVATPPRLLAELIQIARAGSGGGSSTQQIPPFEESAAENLSIGSVYIGSGAVYQIDDLTSLAQSARGWVDQAWTTGQTVEVHQVGVFAKPSALASLPVGVDLFASPGGSITFHGDTVDPLSSGDYLFPMGRSLDGSNFYLNALAPVAGRMP